MQTVNKKNHDLSFIFTASLLIFVGLGCNFPLFAMNHIQTPTTRNATEKEPTSTNEAGCLSGIIPGTTTKTEAIALLGDPVTSRQDGDVEFLFFPSSIKAQFNSISVQNQVVSQVSVIVSENNPLMWSTVKAEYGEPGQTLYSNYSEGTMTYIFPDRGMAFIADETVDRIFIRQCFVPMSIENYMRTWGASLPTEDPYNL